MRAQETLSTAVPPGGLPPDTHEQPVAEILRELQRRESRFVELQAFPAKDVNALDFSRIGVNVRDQNQKPDCLFGRQIRNHAVIRGCRHEKVVRRDVELGHREGRVFTEGSSAPLGIRGCVKPTFGFSVRRGYQKNPGTIIKRLGETNIFLRSTA